MRRCWHSNSEMIQYSLLICLSILSVCTSTVDEHKELGEGKITAAATDTADDAASSIADEESTQDMQQRHDEDIADINMVKPSDGRCRIRGLTYQSDEVICDHVSGLAYNASDCDVRHASENKEHFEKYTCIDGTWHHKQTGTDISLRRMKRGLFRWIVGLVIKVLVTIVCALICEEKEVPANNNAPTYKSCPSDGMKYYAEAGEDDVTVTWDDPVAVDSDGSIFSNTQTTLPLKGEKFEASVDGHPHLISYTAHDNDGASAHCDFTVYAYIHNCGGLQYPKDSTGQITGTRDCNRTTKLGSLCTYTCNTGHERNGSETVTCQLDEFDTPTWTTEPICNVVSCDDPTVTPPLHGYIVCTDTVTFDYQSVCERKCNTGYNGDGKIAMQCMDTGLWDDKPFVCKDIDPPLIQCTTPQLFYADRGADSTAVRWDEPTATDSVDRSPTITRVGGPVQGDVISVGSEYVQYRATDAAGNMSPNCTIELRVEAIPCSHPMDALSDIYMNFDCNATNTVYGITCLLSCGQYLPMNGSDVMSCELASPGAKSGTWDWGNGTKPYCEVVECPMPDAPRNGRLVHDVMFLWHNVLLMECQTGFDIPDFIDGFDGMMYCSDSGSWIPLNEVPDCVVSVLPVLFLPENLYYSGTCNSTDTQEQIKQQYLSVMMEMVDTAWTNICKDNITCSIENVVVDCGLTDRKRRSIHIGKRQVDDDVVRITFNIAVPFNTGNLSVNDTYMLLKGILTDLAMDFGERVTSGAVDVDGLVLQTDGYVYNVENITFNCMEEGYKLIGVKCKPCPSGRQMDPISGKCELCPLGTYKDVDSLPACVQCDIGYSTNTTGAKSIDDCKRICWHGSYSLTGQTPYRLEPCSPCPVGQYQNLEGQDACLDCPAGTITSHNSADSPQLCLDFDLDMSTTTNGANVTSDAFTYVMQSATVSFWLKPVSDVTHNASININTNTNDTISVIIKETLLMEIGSVSYDTRTSLLPDQWSHVAVTWNTTTFKLLVYINGLRTVDENKEPGSTPIIDGGSVSLTSTGATGPIMTYFAIYDRPITESEISSLQDTCASSMPDVRVTMEIFKRTNGSGTQNVVPSRCDALDDCAARPCNGHVCINNIDGFTCHCHDGWSGETCNTAPDHCIDHQCEHESPCVSTNESYTCACIPGYSGHFCENEPVDGGWSDWSEFPNCDVACGGGTQSRYRECINPPKGQYGMDCVGNSTETRTCNNEECLVCPEPIQLFGTYHVCQDGAHNMGICSYECLHGKSLPSGLRSTFQYECGRSTQYEWSPVTEDMPECKRVEQANALGLVSEVKYNEDVSENKADTLGSSVSSNMAALGCTTSNNCKTSVSMTTTRRRKRTTETTVSVQMDFNMTASGGLDIEGYIENGTVSPGLQEMIDTVSLMNNIIEEIQNNTSSVFDVTIDGVLYTVDPDSMSIVGAIHCPEGYSALDGFCVECPAGTKFITGSCTFCEMGTYQDESAKSSCRVCPTGFTTAAIGASSITKCSVSVPVTTTATTTTLTSPDTPPDNTTGLIVAMIAGIAGGAVIALLFMIAVAIFLWKKVCKTRAREDKLGSRGSLGMIRPDRNCHIEFSVKSYGTKHEATNTFVRPRPMSPGVITVTDIDVEELRGVSSPTHKCVAPR